MLARTKGTSTVEDGWNEQMSDCSQAEQRGEARGRETPGKYELRDEWPGRWNSYWRHPVEELTEMVCLKPTAAAFLTPPANLSGANV